MFDIQKARNEGRSDQEIAEYLAGKHGFNLSQAIEDGHGYSEVAEHLAVKEVSPRAVLKQETPVQKTPWYASAFETLQNFGKVYPAAEEAANIATSLYGVPASGIAGLAALPFGLGTAEDVASKVQKALVYEPQTEGGKQLFEAANYPSRLLGAAGAFVGENIEDPTLAASVHTMIEAAPVLATLGYGGIKAIKPSGKARPGAIAREGIEKGIRPSVAGKKTFGQAEKYYKRAEDAVAEIVENKNFLRLTDEYGNIVEGQLPQNLKQFSQAIEQSKRDVFRRYNALAEETGRGGGKVQLGSIVKDLQEIANNKVIQGVKPDVSNYAASLAERLKKQKTFTAVEAQDAIATLNNGLEAFYKSPSYSNASSAFVDSLVANKLRGSLDTLIENATGQQYQFLKKRYGALKSVERDVVRRSVVDARKNKKGLIDFSDIYTGQMAIQGILRADPVLTTAAGSGKFIAWLYRRWNDPNRTVKKMFEGVEKEMAKSKQAIGPFIGPNPYKAETRAEITNYGAAETLSDTEGTP